MSLMSKWLTYISILCLSSLTYPTFYHVFECISKRPTPIILEVGRPAEGISLLHRWASNYKNCEIYSELERFDHPIDLVYLHDCKANDEFLLSYPYLSDETLIMIEGENPIVTYLLDQGYKMILRGEQTILSRVGSDKSKAEFNEIYEKAKWATFYYDCSNAYRGSSGYGSIPHNAKPYLNFLKKFIIKNHIKSVVDFGCGDWQLAREIDWHRVEYLGIDVVPSLIDHHNKYFKAQNIHFLEADGVHIELPKADLLICKDVLQHLPLKDIQIFLKQLSKFKYAILVDTVDLHNPSNNNREIDLGDFRPLDLSSEPFCLPGEKIAPYKCMWGETKMIFLWTNRISD